MAEGKILFWGLCSLPGELLIKLIRTFCITRTPVNPRFKFP
jgi:hypothetical protein